MNTTYEITYLFYDDDSLLNDLRSIGDIKVYDYYTDYDKMTYSASLLLETDHDMYGFDFAEYEVGYVEVSRIEDWENEI